MPAAVDRGLPPNVLKLSAVIVSMISARATMPARVMPLPTPFREREHVGDDVVGLVAPEVFAGAAPPGLDLVGHEEDPVVRQDLLERVEEPVGRRGEAAHALDRFGDQTGDVAGRHHVDHLLEVVGARLGELVVVHVTERTAQSVRTLDEVDREARQAGRRPRRVRRDGLRGERPAVVAVPHRQHFVGLAVAGRQQDRGVVGLRARGGEEHAGVGDARHGGDLLGELDHRLGQVERRGVQDLGGLFLDRRCDSRRCCVRPSS